MAGRYSWLLEKPSYLFSSRERFLVDKAREYMKEDGCNEKLLENPSITHTVLVKFQNDMGEDTVDVTLEKISGELMRWSKY